MKSNGDFESGDLVSLTVAGIECQGTVVGIEFYMGKVKSYRVALSNKTTVSSVPANAVRAASHA